MHGVTEEADVADGNKRFVNSGQQGRRIEETRGAQIESKIGNEKGLVVILGFFLDFT